MTSYDDYFPSNFFKADDAVTGPIDLTIADIHPEKMQDGKLKPVVFFKEDRRGLVLNVKGRTIMSAAPARQLPLAVRDKLGKLLPLLSSNHNGERVGALAAVERVLKGASLDWHDFTAAITATLNAPPPPPPRPAAAEDVTPMAMVDDELIALVTTLRTSRRFTARSEQFLDSLIERAERYDVVHLSAKQIRWLDDLALKAKVATP